MISGHCSLVIWHWNFLNYVESVGLSVPQRVFESFFTTKPLWWLIFSLKKSMLIRVHLRLNKNENILGAVHFGSGLHLIFSTSYFKTLATVAPISAGLSLTWTPQDFSAAIFSAAVPFPPAMMAPACPMRRPGGAV